MSLARTLRFRVPCLAATLLLAASCRAPAVTDFTWKDAAGSPLPFTQSSSWPAGEEGRFLSGRQSNRYCPEKSLIAPAGSSIIVAILRGEPSDAHYRVRLSLSGKADGSSPFVAAAFPLLAKRASLCLPIDASSRIASLGVSVEGQAGAFSIESVALGPAFRGIEGNGAELKVSADFSLTMSREFQELTLTKPFANIGALPGILLEYGPSAQGAIVRLDALAGDGSSRRYTIRTHPGGSSTALDAGVLPRDAAQLTLRAPRDVGITAFYAAQLSKADGELADLGRVLIADAPVGDYSLFRWDLIPSVLILDFQDYDTQSRYLKRLAFFVEKLGYRGRLAKDGEIAGAHDWNAHDYRPEDLARFFQVAREKSFPLNDAEKGLGELLLREGVIVESGARLGPGKGAIISITRESSAALRRTFAVHESAHAIFFADAEYRRFASELWSSLEPGERWFWKTYFAFKTYDVGSDYLMGNEFQAYLLQQPVPSAEDYFVKGKSAELLEKHPELEERLDAYMAEYGDSFAQRARQLEAWLYRKYGVEAGRMVFLTREK
jgi:hypothetical protein